MNQRGKLLLAGSVILLMLLVAGLCVAVGYRMGYAGGFNACIEETNSYHLYNN